MTKLSRTREIMAAEDEEVLVALVMTLTGGSANPGVVRAQVKQWKRLIEELKP